MGAKTSVVALEPAREAPAAFDVRALVRPDRALLKLYLLQSCAALVLFPFVFVPLWARYRSLRYAFDDEGVGASWGVLFRREVYLTYARIQDIGVRRNLLERWLGIARIEVQTAAASADAELALEGMRDHEAVRDYLYARMRGSAGESDTGGGGGAVAPHEPEAVRLLREIKEELVATRAALEARASRSD